jgi:hypothetical protein
VRNTRAPQAFWFSNRAEKNNQILALPTDLNKYQILSQFKSTNKTVEALVGKNRKKISITWEWGRSSKSSLKLKPCSQRRRATHRAPETLHEE